jgi:predicted NBD/HSP70 family sugar kinase
MRVRQDGPRCSCGRWGHLEALAAGPAIARQAMEALEEGRDSTLGQPWREKGTLTAAEVGRHALQGDSLAHSLIVRAGNAIGSHLASLVHAFNPARIVIGGGVSQVGEPLFQAIRKTLADEVMHPAYLRSLQVLPASLGDDAGLVGACVLARSQ